MSLELADLFFLRIPESVGPLRVKVGAGASAVLAFATSDAAIRCARTNHFEPDVVQLAEIFSDELLREPLLVFRSPEEIDLAYANQKAYDFSVHLCPWPSK